AGGGGLRAGRQAGGTARRGGTSQLRALGARALLDVDGGGARRARRPDGRVLRRLGDGSRGAEGRRWAGRLSRPGRRPAAGPGAPGRGCGALDLAGRRLLRAGGEPGGRPRRPAGPTGRAHRIRRGAHRAGLVRHHGGRAAKRQPGRGRPARRAGRLRAHSGRSRAANWIASPKVGYGWIVSRRTSTGTSARTASVSCPSHSPASGPTATAPTSTPRSGSAKSLRNPGRFGRS